MAPGEKDPDRESGEDKPGRDGLVDLDLLSHTQRIGRRKLVFEKGNQLSAVGGTGVVIGVVVAAGTQDVVSRTREMQITMGLLR